MTSFASLLLALLVPTGSTPRDTTLPAPIAGRIRAAIATRWSADSQDIELSWGQLSSNISQLSTAQVSFPGAIDRDGWMAVVLTPTSGSPLAMRVRAGERRLMPAAAHALDAGRILERSDVSMTSAVRWGAPDSVVAADVIGWEVRHALRAGDALRGAAILAPVLVRSGETVVFVWDRNGVHMEYQTVALGTARLGDMVQGRSGTTRITGIVTGAGVARVEVKSQ